MTDEPTPNALSDKPIQPSDATRVERNKAASRRWIEVFNQRDDAAEADVRAPGFVAYAPASLEPAPWTPRHGPGFSPASSPVSLTFGSRWRRAWAKATL